MRCVARVWGERERGRSHSLSFSHLTHILAVVAGLQNHQQLAQLPPHGAAAAAAAATTLRGERALRAVLASSQEHAASLELKAASMELKVASLTARLAAAEAALARARAAGFDVEKE